ncbi:phospholipase [Zopfia rhizophila CBS 207.26]|uniref:Phospholipase n=1 Tax=Zopfia rhizophila CBS 207.26 TaxID=1314779 RepID=A0A6A6DVV0_9PEZI|nr:phospholipase [Zopfia rhizophila CBS 207.26]
MSIDECIAAYTSLSDRVFQKKTIIPIKVKGELRERFDSEKLKQVVKEMITKKGLEEDALLKDEPDAICKVFVCATSRQAAGTVCLTSYRSLRSDNDLLKATKIWEACRATSAASSFFDPITIGPLNEEFLDGGTGANNPVWELWHQAQIVWGHQMLEKNLKCLVSIGTGVSSHKPFKDNVFRIHDTLIAMATETEQTAERFRKDKSHLSDEGRYFRFNVWHGLEDIGLEESKKIKDIAAVTRKYLSLEEVYKQMEKCASSLRQPIS